MKKALITGISGQDGSYLAEYLLGLGYEVHGTLRRHSVAENQDTRIQHLGNRVMTHYADMTDSHSVNYLVNSIKPDEIYSLAAQSHVQISFKMPGFTFQSNTMGVLNLLEAMKMYMPGAKLYHSGSSEMFGSSCDHDGFQRETTHMTPVSPYGCSKLAACSLVKNYRKAYDLFAANGILFNHSSPRRGMNFVEQKIIYGAVAIKFGLANSLLLGNLESYRDFGHSKDYVRAMHAILQQDKPDEFVIATGQTRSVREVCQFVFHELGLDYEDYVGINPEFLRPQELPYLRGDSTKARADLGWEPKYTAEALFKEMIEAAILNTEGNEASKHFLEITRRM